MLRAKVKAELDRKGHYETTKRRNTETAKQLIFPTFFSRTPKLIKKQIQLILDPLRN